MSLAFFATASPSGSDEARADQAIDRAERGAAGRSAHHPEYIPIAHSVAAATAHHSNGTISSSQRMRRHTRTSAATVPIAVGSGVTPKVSAVVHGRPASGASSGYPATRIASNADTSTIRTSASLHRRDHALAHRRVGHATGRRIHILAHVIGAGCRRDRAGDSGVGNDELQYELRPARAVDVRRPRRKRLPRQRAEQGALAERPVHDDRDAAIAREWQDALLDLTIHGVVGDLNEVERMAAHDLLEVA